MLSPRIIPALLLSNGGLVKTTEFAQPKYVGDPINTVRIFNEKGVDEIMVIDIDATSRSKPINLKLIGNIAAECRMPLCYGGGVRTVSDVESIVQLGVEKVAISSAAVADINLIAAAARHVGRQSIVAVMDVRKDARDGRYRVFTRNGTAATGMTVEDFAVRAQEAGAGEIVVNSIDRDGRMCGYDLDLVGCVASHCEVPLTVLGGAGTYTHLEELFRRFGVIGAAAGSLFVFKGKFRAVLISYPHAKEKGQICSAAHGGRVK